MYRTYFEIISGNNNKYVEKMLILFFRRGCELHIGGIIIQIILSDYISYEDMYIYRKGHGHSCPQKAI